MSDVPEQAGAPVAEEQGNADASLGTTSGAGSQETPASLKSSGTGAENAANTPSESGEQGNAAAGESQSSQPCLDSGESTSAGELPNGVDTLRVAPATPAAMVSRVEAAALQAYNSGNTSEHNLMAWLHTHLTGAKAATAGAESLEGLTPEAKSILADLKTLL